MDRQYIASGPLLETFKHAIHDTFLRHASISFLNFSRMAFLFSFCVAVTRPCEKMCEHDDRPTQHGERSQLTLSGVHSSSVMTTPATVSMPDRPPLFALACSSLSTSPRTLEL